MSGSENEEEGRIMNDSLYAQEQELMNLDDLQNLMGRANDIHQDFINGTSSLLKTKDLKSSIIEQTHNEQSTLFENLMKITKFFYQEQIKQIEFKTNLKQDLLELQDDNRRFL